MLIMLRRTLEFLLTALCVALMVGLTAIIAGAVITRKLGTPFGWYDEIASIMLAWITFYGAALAALRRGHLGFPNAVAATPPHLRVWLVVLREALVIGFFAVMGWYGFEVVRLLQGDHLVTLTWMPITFTQSVIPGGALMFILAELTTIPERLEEARRGAEAHDPERALAEAET